MLTLVCLHINEEGARVYDAYNAANSNHPKTYVPLDVTELLGFIGLLYLSGIYRGKREPYKDLWSLAREGGRMIFSATMARNRFTLLLRLHRFDDKDTRDDRKKLDNFAAMRELWNLFVERLTAKLYIPSPFLTIDEMLAVFRGRC